MRAQRIVEAPVPLPARRIRTVVLAAVVVLSAAIVVAVFGASARLPRKQDHGTGSSSVLRPVQTWILHFSPAHAPSWVPTYRGLLREMAPNAHVVFATWSSDNVSLCRKLLGREFASDPRITILDVDAPVSPWARDRYVVFENAGRRHLVLPFQAQASTMPQDDGGVGRRLAALHPDLHVRQPPLRFEGGDLLLTDEKVLVGATTIASNIQHLGLSPREVHLRLRELFGRTVVVVGGNGVALPYDHIDMFLTALDDTTLVLGDPRLGLSVFDDTQNGKALDAFHAGELGVFRRHVQRARIPVYDRLAESLQREGFRLLRLPILHGESLPDGARGVVLNWNNVVMEARAGRRHVYLPGYGVPPLDDQARSAWQSMGYETHVIDARGAVRAGGGIRCLTNTLRARRAVPATEVFAAP